MGYRHTWKREHDVCYESEHGMVVGFVRGADPLTNAIQLGFLLHGLNWTQHCPGLLDHVALLWEKSREPERGNKGKRGQLQMTLL